MIISYENGIINLFVVKLYTSLCDFILTNFFPVKTGNLLVISIGGTILG